LSVEVRGSSPVIGVALFGVWKVSFVVLGSRAGKMWDRSRRRTSFAHGQVYGVRSGVRSEVSSTGSMWVLVTSCVCKISGSDSFVPFIQRLNL
jgi:hypothetical protein